MATVVALTAAAATKTAAAKATFARLGGVGAVAREVTDLATVVALTAAAGTATT